ncbi:putative baseplate assembly protein [Streptomyces sp. NPDC001652]|uniref:putative baseplate assembly protein n=1 Tax=Streptomyces sp. NPDC001652 TaxID=3154393 RepID=UPI003332A260
MRYDCRDADRLRAVREAGRLNGIAWVEVRDRDEARPLLRQRTLFVRLLAPPARTFGPGTVRIDGGRRVPVVGVQWAAPATALPPGEDPALLDGQTGLDTLLVVRTAVRGDFSPYRLRLLAAPDDDRAPAGFDPLLAAVEFTFKAECEAETDCGPAVECPPETGTTPVIDYRAKDYGSLRALMLDRLALLAPGRLERTPADLGVALVELLAYVGDQLSYRQDAVATEAYLGTARRRVSLRRHARLVDYRVHEGAAARTWARITVQGEGVPLSQGTPLLTRVPNLPARFLPDGPEHRAALTAGAETFETVEDAVLYATHDRFTFWTWGDSGCCLPRGATGATLLGHHPALKAGDVLVLAEVASPTTGRPQDADPAQRCAVRLTEIRSVQDPSGGLFTVPPSNAPVDVTEVVWDEADALPFALCVSAPEWPGRAVAVAFGNIVPADHGRTLPAEPLGTVPAPTLYTAGGVPVPARFRPALSRAPLTRAHPAPARLIAQGPADLAPAATGVSPALRDWLTGHGITFRAGTPVLRGGHDHWSISDGTTIALLRLEAGALRLYDRPAAASATLTGDPHDAAPAVTLTGTLHGTTEPWHPRADLLASDGSAADFVVEAEHDGTAVLRFGDGTYGRRPETGTAFLATYRVGNGTAGDIGSGVLAHVAGWDAAVLAVTNPLPALGGTEPEPADAVRRDAPQAYLVQERAVTADDYAEAARRHPGVQRAAARFRWTGSWHTVFLGVDRTGGLDVDAPFETSVRRHLERFRAAGYDLEVDGPRVVPLEVALHLCVAPDHFRAQVKEAVRQAVRPLFHPDALTFGRPVHLSPVVAAAQSVPGVTSVTPVTFRRRDEPAEPLPDTGVLTMGRLETARLDDDPNLPEHGVLTLTAGGGK